MTHPLKRTALIVDDDPLFQVMVEAMLVDSGFDDVLTADDGVQGLKVIADLGQTLDLVISDLQMPNMDGVAFIRELAQLKYEGAVLIASSEKADILRTAQTMARMLGVHLLGGLSKPLDQERLNGLLDNARLRPQETNPVSRDIVKAALSNQRLLPVYQPKLDLRARKVTGVEVLARAFDRSGTVINTQRFVDAAETHGLIQELTSSMISRALADFDAGGFVDQSFGMAINISPLELHQLDLPERLESVFRDGGMSPERVTLEVTENRIIEKSPNVLDVLLRLRLKGFQLSIDDFGTGATSIEQLRLFPFNDLKVDRSFVLAAVSDPFARTAVETSAQLAAMVGIDLIAEGVETPEALALVTRAGARVAQGYLIARPMPVDALADWLQAAPTNLSQLFTAQS